MFYEYPFLFWVVMGSICLRWLLGDSVCQEIVTFPGYPKQLEMEVFIFLHLHSTFNVSKNFSNWCVSYDKIMNSHISTVELV